MRRAGPAGARLRRPVVLLAVLALTGSVVAATSTVPPSLLGSDGATINANALKPGSCAGISLDAVVTGSGTFAAGNGAELVIGSAGVDSINARNGDDCVLGGGGDDQLDGLGGTDVCIGGPGTDTFVRCETEIQ